MKQTDIPRQSPADPASPPDRLSVSGRMRSFGCAAKGLRFAIKTQPNFWLQLAILCAVVALGILFAIEPGEWLVIVAASAAVFTAELLNTAIELLVDHVNPGYHETAGRVKDIAAGAVLVAALAAAAAGVVIFLPKIIVFLGRL